jgi:hypothetical protein
VKGLAKTFKEISTTPEVLVKPVLYGYVDALYQ